MFLIKDPRKSQELDVLFWDTQKEWHRHNVASHHNGSQNQVYGSLNAATNREPDGSPMQNAAPYGSLRQNLAPSSYGSPRPNVANSSSFLQSSPCSGYRNSPYSSPYSRSPNAAVQSPSASKHAATAAQAKAARARGMPQSLSQTTSQLPMYPLRNSHMSCPNNPSASVLQSQTRIPAPSAQLAAAAAAAAAAAERAWEGGADVSPCSSGSSSSSSSRGGTGREGNSRTIRSGVHTSSYSVAGEAEAAQAEASRSADLIAQEQAAALAELYLFTGTAEVADADSISTSGTSSGTSSGTGSGTDASRHITDISHFLVSCATRSITFSSKNSWDQSHQNQEETSRHAPPWFASSKDMIKAISDRSVRWSLLFQARRKCCLDGRPLWSCRCWL